MAAFKWGPLVFGLAMVLAATGFAGETEELVNSVQMRFAYLGPGTFSMGRPDGEPGFERDEQVHSVTLSKGFYLQTTEVTQSQWQMVMGTNPSHFKTCGPDCPVENVSWLQAKAFIDRLNAKEKTDVYRLPTEAEWEYAARGGNPAAFGFGNCLADKANYNGNFPWSQCPEEKYQYPGKPVPVGSYPPNEWGLYDMHGNVREWCQDWYGRYSSGPATDPKGPPRSGYRVNRGGSWYAMPSGCRSANRDRNEPEIKHYTLGFRVARDR